MLRKQNLINLKTEKEGIKVLKEAIPSFFVPSKSEKEIIYEKLNIDFKKYSRSVDGIILNVDTISDILNENDVILVEIKSTKAKNIKKLPYGVFFGITKNEEDLFKSLNNYRLCIVHTLSKEYIFLNFTEYESLIKNKRIQYQVNFKKEIES
ncbi:MAG: hypothetical protein MK202_05985 [Tenacibaculum sp.]|nr:hypothetical protein [Tenacibaculum sp.]